MFCVATKSATKSARVSNNPKPQIRNPPVSKTVCTAPGPWQPPVQSTYLMETGTGHEWLCEVGQYYGFGVDFFFLNSVSAVWRTQALNTHNMPQ